MTMTIIKRGIPNDIHIRGANNTSKKQHRHFSYTVRGTSIKRIHLILYCAAYVCATYSG
jgi:hypothetical protein